MDQIQIQVTNKELEEFPEVQAEGIKNSLHLNAPDTSGLTNLVEPEQHTSRHRSIQQRDWQSDNQSDHLYRQRHHIRSQRDW